MLEVVATLAALFLFALICVSLTWLILTRGWYPFSWHGPRPPRKR